MSRTPTTTDTTVEWEERVTDPDSDSLTLSLVLDAVDDGSGFTNDGTDSSNLSWLSFTKTASTLNDGTLENLVNIVADKSGLNQGYTYRFKITADDGTTAVPRTFTLSIEEPPPYTGNYWAGSDVSNGQLAIVPLDSAWDIGYLSTSTVTDSANITADPSSTNSESIVLKPDGTKVYVTAGSGTIREYELTTAYDINTLNKVNEASISLNTIFITADGQYLYTAGLRGPVDKYSFGTAWDTSTLTLEQSTNLGNTFSDHDIEDVWVSTDGSVLFGADADDGGRVYKLTFDTAHDLNSLKDQQDVTLNNQKQRGIFVKPDLTKLYLQELDGELHQYTLSTPGDLNSASLDKSAVTENARGVTFD